MSLNILLYSSVNGFHIWVLLKRLAFCVCALVAGLFLPSLPALSERAARRAHTLFSARSRASTHTTILWCCLLAQIADHLYFRVFLIVSCAPPAAWVFLAVCSCDLKKKWSSRFKLHNYIMYTGLRKFKHFYSVCIFMRDSGRVKLFDASRLHAEMASNLWWRRHRCSKQYMFKEEIWNSASLWISPKFG
jgi:hypothetical protein